MIVVLRSDCSAYVDTTVAWPLQDYPGHTNRRGVIHYYMSNVKFELSFQFVCMNSHGFLNVALPSSPWIIHSGVQLARLNCLLWLSVRLFYCLRLLPFIIHSSRTSYLSLSYENKMALAETTSSYF
jgi:hypothetical protein